MSSGKKVWNSTSIRELARRRLKEQEERTKGRPTFGSGHHRFDAPEPESDRAADLIDVQPAGEHEFSWGNYQKSVGNRVLIVVPVTSFRDDGSEIRQLCATMGLDCVDLDYHKKAHRVNPASFFGKGTLEKMRDRMQGLGATALIVDAHLTPAQVRNMEKTIEAPVIDREGVILSIFEKHAKTSLAKMQVELAQLRYLQPRLAGQWMGLSRQSGGGGVKGRGQGETRLELDRRVVKDRIAFLSKKLKGAERMLKVQSGRRSQLPRVALVGYTNAGKSTLMNRLTKSGVEESNRLFSTLDTTVRALVPPTEPRILVSDTVGFVRDLPHGLVASFKSTLREALESQLVLHVLDCSSDDWLQHYETTHAVLDELEVGGENRILVLNKMDLIEGIGRIRVAEITRELRHREDYISHFAISSLNGDGIDALKKALIEHFSVNVPEWARI